MFPPAGLRLSVSTSGGMRHRRVYDHRLQSATPKRISDGLVAPVVADPWGLDLNADSASTTLSASSDVADVGNPGDPQLNLNLVQR